MRLINITDEGKRFIDEWENGKDYVVAHTSGSTGTPKEIRLPKADMACSAQATILDSDVMPNRRIVASAEHDISALGNRINFCVPDEPDVWATT